MFWSLSLLQHTHEIRINELIKILTGNNIMPIQYSLIEAKPITDQQIIRDIEISLDLTNPTLLSRKGGLSNHKNTNNKNTTDY